MSGLHSSYNHSQILVSCLVARKVKGIVPRGVCCHLIVLAVVRVVSQDFAVLVHVKTVEEGPM